MRVLRKRSGAAALERIELVVLALLALALFVGAATMGYVESRIRQTFVEVFSIDPSLTLRPVMQLQRETLRLQVAIRDVARSGVVNEDDLRLRWQLMQSRVVVLTQDTIGQRLQPESRQELTGMQPDLATLDSSVEKVLGGVVAGSPVEPARRADQALTTIELGINRMSQIESNARTFSAGRIGDLLRLVRTALVVIGVLLLILTGGLVLITRRAAGIRVLAATQELETARSIQQALLPQRLPPIDGIDVAWHFRAAAETSGDFYDFLTLGPQRVGLVVADVTGHGMAAALIASGARQTLRSELFHHQDDLAQALTQTNRWLYTDMPQRRFVAASCALIDTAERRITLANAGQMSPLLWRDGELSYLEPPGLRLPLGISQASGYATLELALEPGDLLVFYTDGVVEAQNSRGELFGFERLEASIRASEGSAAQISECLLQAIGAFAGNDLPHDDMTLVVVRSLLVSSDEVDPHDTSNYKGTYVVA